MSNCPFKIGEYIFCLESSNDSVGSLQTKGKIYKVIVTSKAYDNIGILGDPIPQLPNGRQFIPSWWKFITLKEARKRKLSQIDENSQRG